MKAIVSAIVICFFSFGLLGQIVFENQGPEIGMINSNFTDGIVDMDGNGLDDIVVVNQVRMTVFYQFENNQWEQKKFDWNFTTQPDWGMCAGDFDGNGVMDLVLGGYSSVSFYMGSNDGEAYTEIVQPEDIFAQRSTSHDIDNDGDLDAFVCNDVAINHPYINDGDGNLKLDIDLIPTADMAGNYSAVWVDYDNDGDSDLYLTKCFVGTSSVNDVERINLLYRNNGDGTFDEVGEEANMDDNAQNWTTNFEDFDNDGDFDAWIISHEDGFAEDVYNRLMINNGDGTFTDTIHSSMLPTYANWNSWESTTADFNNDGYMDILAHFHGLFLNNGDLTFTKVDGAQFTRGAIGDLNNDGFIDVVRNDKVYINQANDNNWVKIITDGTVSNLDGIGSRVEIYGEWGMQIREVRSSQSFRTMNTINTHFGIGESESIDSLVIKWPSGMRTVIEDPEINTTHKISEFACVLPSEEIIVEGNLELCEGEVVLLSAPGGFVYSWSNGSTSQSIEVGEPGNYQLFMFDDAGCAATSNIVQVSIIVEETPNIEPSGLINLCEGGSITLSASANVDEITWNNGQVGETIEITESGVYFVEVDGECPGAILSSQTANIEILDPNPPVIDDILVGQDNVATVTASGDKLYWYEEEVGGAPIGFGSVFQTEMLTNDLTLWLENRLDGWAGFQCSSERIPVEIQVNSNEDLLIEFGVELFPNPATEIVNITTEKPEDIDRIELINIHGQLISTFAKNDFNEGTLSVEVDELPEGTYQINFHSGLSLFTKSFVVLR